MKTITSLTYDIDGKLGKSRFEKKHNVIFKSQDEINSEIPVTFLKNSSNPAIGLNLFSRFEFTRFFIDCHISIKNIKNKANVWLFKKTKQSILKTAESDYNDNGMSDPLDYDDAAFVIESSVIKIQSISIIN